MYPYPVLFSLGSVKVFTYGLFLFLAFLSGLWLALRRRESLTENHVYNLSFLSLVLGVIGARIGYIIFNPVPFLDYFSVWKGGLSFFGGLFLGVIGIVIYSRKHNLGFWKIADILSPSLVLGVAITRIGGFLAGVNPGLPTSLPWAIFHNGQYTHPVALYYVIANFIILFILLKKKDELALGKTFLLTLILYSISRFFLDFLRTFDGAVFIAARIVPLLLIIFSLIMWKYVREYKNLNTQTV